MEKLILIKLGGSLITDKTKPFVQKPGAIKRLVKEIHQAKKETGKLVIVGHGGGSFPHVPAKRYQTQNGVVNQKSCLGIAKVQDAAAQLNRIIVAQFLLAGENAISFNPSSFMIAQNGEIKKAFLESINKALRFGILPVVYGDVAFDLKMGCCILSTEKILNFLAKSLRDNLEIEKIICAGITDGVYDENGKTIKRIRKGQFSQLKSALGGSEGIDVTGGMVHKVEQALKFADLGIKTLIINGEKEGNLKKAVLGEKVKGTLIME